MRFPRLKPAIFGAVWLASLGAAADAAPAGSCAKHTLGPIVADIPSVEVRPEFLLNGKPFPGSGVALITLWVRDASPLFDAPQLSLGRTDEIPPAVRVVPGEYDVYYSWVLGTEIPRNQMTRIRRGVSIRADGVLRIDVPMIRVAGVKRHNGEAFPDDGSAATLSLRCVGHPGEVLVGGTLPAEFDLRLIPGSYSLAYDWALGGTIPRNRHATVRRLALRTGRSHLVLDVPSVTQDFVLTHNGAAFPSTAYEHGDIVLTRPDGEEVLVGSSHEPPQTIRLIPGTYDAHWRFVAGAGIVPRNENAPFRQGLVVDGTIAALDVASVEVSGDIRVNGQVPPATAYENARLRLTVPETGDVAYLGDTRNGGYSSRVVPGRYDIVYEHVAGGSVLPSNPKATLAQGWDVVADSSRTIDIPAGTYSGTFLLNGEAFPESQYESGSLHLLPLSGEDPVILGYTTASGFERRLIPGWYRSAYAREAGYSIVPSNVFTTFGHLRRVFQGDGPAPASDVLDVPAATLTVSYEHNGVPLPEGGPANARVLLQRGPNSLQLLDSAGGPSVRVAMEGRFDLFYQYRGGPDVPRNAFMPFGCWDLAR